MKRKNVSDPSAENGIAVRPLDCKYDSSNRARELVRRLGELVGKALADRAAIGPDTPNSTDGTSLDSQKVAL